MKKLISVALVLMMVLSLSVAAFAADTCIVAGVSGLCGTNWDQNDSNNAMTLKGNVFEKVYKNVPAGDYQFKVVHNGSWKGVNGNNVMFSVAAPCDVTITYNPADGAITYTGANIGKTAFKVDAIYAVGAANSAAPAWLNGENWNQAAASNKMTEVETGVYAIIYANLPASKYEFKFAADGAWDHSWGGSFSEFDAEADISYNGGNITFELTETKDVTLVLDLSNFSLDAGGAKYKVALSAPGTAVLPTPGGDNTDEPTEPSDKPTEPSDEPTEPTDKPTEPTDKPTEPTAPVSGEYYLIGYFNGADYDGTDYKFENGKVTATFTADSYVMVKSGEVTYMTNDWQGTEATSVTLSDSTTLAKGDKLFVPGNKALTFTLVENADGTLTLSYTAAASDDNNGGEKPDAPVTGTESSFRVVGNADWMGNWDPASNAGRLLEVSAGVYKQVFENVQPGNYEMKITQNGTWDKSWGDNGNNFCFSVIAACKVTVTFTFDANGEGLISVTGEGVNPITADINMISVFVLMGLAVCAAGILVINKKKFI